MDAFEWRQMLQLEPEHIRETKALMHQAIQNVAAVGRKFLPKSKNDVNASLIWVPGLSRMAGQWVTGEVDFRSSLSIEKFEVFLVDKKVTTLASFQLEGKTYRQLMVWLEEQIGKLGMPAADLTMNLPYEIPNHPVREGSVFQLAHARAAVEFSKFYHNTYIILRKIKKQFESQNEILIWPHHFDIALSILIKDTGDPETDTIISFGMSPGDENFENPYFYVNTWPHVDTSQCAKLSNNALWVSEDWTGAIMLSKHIYEADQQKRLEMFYEESSEQLIQMLTK